MNKNNLAVTLVVAAACWTSAAQGEDLIQVYDLALLNNPTLNAAAARLSSTKEGKTQARANLQRRADDETGSRGPHAAGPGAGSG